MGTSTLEPQAPELVHGSVKSGRKCPHMPAKPERTGEENETTHEKKGCTSTKGTDDSSSTDRKWQRRSGLMQEATKIEEESDRQN